MVHWGTQASGSEVRMKINEEIWSLMGCTNALPFTSNSNEHQSIYGRDVWSKNSNQTCKIKKKSFPQSQDIKISESISTSQNWQDLIGEWKSIRQAMVKGHHTRNPNWLMLGKIPN